MFPRHRQNSSSQAVAREQVPGLATSAAGVVYPERPLLKELLALQYRINRSRVEYAALCSLVGVKNTRTPKGNPALVYTVRDKVRGSGRLHKVSLSAQDDVPVDKTHYGVVMCTCEDWTFRSEFALAEANWSLILRSNGEPPGTKNPRHELFLCKHTLLAIAHLYRKTL